MVDYDIQGKRELDREMDSLVMEYYKKHDKDPIKITLSPSKFRHFKRVFPLKYKTVIEYNGIPVEVDTNQTEDYHLVAE